MIAAAGPSSVAARTRFGRKDIREPCVLSCGNKMRFIGQIDSFQFSRRDNANRKDDGDKQFLFGYVEMDLRLVLL